MAPKRSRDDQIVAMYRTPKSLREVARAFGITHERVRQILRGRGEPLHPRFRPLQRSAAKL